MSIIADQELHLLFQELKRVFSKTYIEEKAVETGFMKRKTKLKPEYFLLLCSCLGDSFGKKSLVQLCAQLCATFGLELTTEGLNQRFNSQAVKFLKEIFESIFSKQVAKPIIEKRLFERIRIMDSTSFEVPSNYGEYKGTRGSGVKIQLEYELYQASFLHLLVQEGRENDNNYPKVIRDDIKHGDLCLRDLGYFSVSNLDDINQRQGYYLSRMKNNMNLYQQEKNGDWVNIDLEKIKKKLKRGEVMELQNIKVGYWVKKPLISRVVIAKLTKEQEAQRKLSLDKKKKKGKKPLSAEKNISLNIYLTNIPQSEVKKEEIHPLYSLRWQIEILFKTWKSLFEIQRVKKMKKERFECHLYGTLIRLLLSSTLAFQCRRMLYKKHQMETSEYKSISIAKECLSLFKDIVGNQNILDELYISIYQSIKINGRKCRRQQKKTVFDILKIAYKQTMAIAS